MCISGQVPYGADITRVIITIEEEFLVEYSFFAYSFLELVAEIGGYLSLFVGPSLYTLSDYNTYIISKSTLSTWSTQVNIWEVICAHTARPLSKHGLRVCT